MGPDKRCARTHLPGMDHHRSSRSGPDAGRSDANRVSSGQSVASAGLKFALRSA